MDQVSVDQSERSMENFLSNKSVCLGLIALDIYIYIYTYNHVYIYIFICLWRAFCVSLCWAYLRGTDMQCVGCDSLGPWALCKQRQRQQLALATSGS